MSSDPIDHRARWHLYRAWDGSIELACTRKLQDGKRQIARLIWEDDIYQQHYVIAQQTRIEVEDKLPLCLNMLADLFETSGLSTSANAAELRAVKNHLADMQKIALGKLA